MDSVPGLQPPRTEEGFPPFQWKLLKINYSPHPRFSQQPALPLLANLVAFYIVIVPETIRIDSLISVRFFRSETATFPAPSASIPLHSIRCILEKSTNIQRPERAVLRQCFSKCSSPCVSDVVHSFHYHSENILIENVNSTVLFPSENASVFAPSAPILLFARWSYSSVVPRSSFFSPLFFAKASASAFAPTSPMSAATIRVCVSVQA